MNPYTPDAKPIKSYPDKSFSFTLVASITSTSNSFAIASTTFLVFPWCTDAVTITALSEQAASGIKFWSWFSNMTGDVVFNNKETSDIMSGRGISDIGDIKGFQSKMLKGVSNVPKTNNISNMSNKNETTIHVDKVELPNVRNGNDAEKLVAALCNLDGTVTQKLHS